MSWVNMPCRGGNCEERGRSWGKKRKRGRFLLFFFRGGKGRGEGGPAFSKRDGFGVKKRRSFFFLSKGKKKPPSSSEL